MNEPCWGDRRGLHQVIPAIRLFQMPPCRQGRCYRWTPPRPRPRRGRTPLQRLSSRASLPEKTQKHKRCMYIAGPAGVLNACRKRRENQRDERGLSSSACGKSPSRQLIARQARTISGSGWDSKRSGPPHRRRTRWVQESVDLCSRLVRRSHQV